MNNNRHELRRILQAGYPLVRYEHSEDEDGEARLVWWAEDSTESALHDAYVETLTHAGEAEMEEAFQRLMDYQADLAERTIAAIRRQGNVHDLCRLIDAASTNGEASCPDAAAGLFLRRVAELALRGITHE